MFWIAIESGEQLLRRRVTGWRARLVIVAVLLLVTLPVVIGQPEMLRRINALIREIQRTPHSGTGKPDPLRHALAGQWSRRIAAENRIVYRVTEDSVCIAQLRYHY